jgi:hypothetical protein
MEKCDVRWGDLLEFLELFLMEKYDVIGGDVAYSLNFQNYFSIENGDVAWGHFLEFLELFLNREMWHATWIFRIIFQWRKVMWHEMIFLNFKNYFSMEKDDVKCSMNFEKYFSMKKDDMAWDDVAYLHVK